MKEIEELIEISRKYGKDSRYVIAGGGNTSYKNAEKLWVKASGCALATITEDGFAVLDRKKLNVISEKTYSSDTAAREEEVKNDLAAACITKDRRPSVETSMHNALEANFIVHLHPTMVNGLMCGQNAEAETARLFGDEAVYIPYTDPGYVLFKEVDDRIKAYKAKFGKEPAILLLQNHGIFVGGPAFSFKPGHLAADAFGGHDVLFIGVAHYEHLFGLQVQSFDSEAEYARVGLAHAHNGAFYYILEIVAQVEVAQHALDIAVEVAHKYHGILLVECLKRGACLLDALARLIVAVLCNVGCKSVDGLALDGSVVGEMCQLDFHFLEQQHVEVVVGHYVTNFGKFTLGIHVSLTECVLVDFHSRCPVSVPDYFAPVGAAAVDCAAVVKYYTFNIFHPQAL